MSRKKGKGIYNKYKGYARPEIQHYCKENLIKEEDFRFLSMNQWQNVYDKVLDNFVDYEYARYNGLHWFNINGGRKKEIFYMYDSRDDWEWVLKLPEIVRESEEMLYLLLDEGGIKSKFWIAEGKANVIAKLLHEELVNDDYYIVQKKYEWMITKNHHEMISFIGRQDKLNIEVLKNS